MSTPVKGRSETVAAVMNGLLVVLLPLAVLVAASSIDLGSSDASVTANVPGSPRFETLIPMLVRATFVLFPFALLAGWRTWVYARRWCDRQDRGWMAVVEAGACGLMLALLYLAPGIVTRPAEAPPYVIAYAGFALLLGVVSGLFLRTTAIVILKLRKSTAA
jgi:uncharacterized membrane protein YhaH (DUF805 family)